MAKGRGSIKPTPATPKQPTLLHLMRESEVVQERDDDVLEVEEAKDRHEIEQEAEKDVQGIEESEGEEEVQVEASGGEADEEVQVQASGGEADDEEVEVVESGDEERDVSDVVELGGRFPSDHPFLVGLRQHLVSRHGKGRSEREAVQISHAVSEFLFSSGPVLDVAHLYDAKKLDKFLSSLEAQNKKPSTQHAKLCRIKQGLMYVHLSLDPAKTVQAEKCLTLIGNWLSTLGKEARKMKRAHLEDMSDRGSASMTEIERFTRSTEMANSLRTLVQRTKAGERVAQGDLRQIMIWLAGCLLHSNAQRPGAITNATVEEYGAATVSTVGREVYKTLLVANHKTATTGRAKLTLNRYLTQQMDLFLAHIRPSLEGSSSTLLFPNREGKHLDHLSRHVEKLATKLGIKLPRTATETRHAAATAVAGSSDVQRTAVAAAMSHSKRTQELYYSLNKGKKDAVEGYRVMEGIRREERDGREAARVQFSEEDAHVIALFFSDHISGAKAPSIEECRDFLKQHQIGRSAKQVRDKVRNLIGRRK